MTIKCDEWTLTRDGLRSLHLRMLCIPFYTFNQRHTLFRHILDIFRFCMVLLGFWTFRIRFVHLQALGARLSYLPHSSCMEFSKYYILSYHGFFLSRTLDIFVFLFGGYPLELSLGICIFLSVYNPPFRIIVLPSTRASASLNVRFYYTMECGCDTPLFQRLFLFYMCSL